MLDDVAAYDCAKATLSTGDDALVPAVIVDAILGGESPVRIWRQHRGLSQSQLGEAAGISQIFGADRDREAGGQLDALSVAGRCPSG